MIHNTYYCHEDLNRLPPYEIKVINFGISGSGSTFIYQLLTDLYSSGVVKTHDFYKPQSRTKVKVIATIRDFRDCLVSLHRRWFPEATEVNDAIVRESGQKILGEIRSLRQYLLYHNCQILRYEEFIPDPNVIFDTIEQLFDIRLSIAERTKMAASHSIEANRKIADVMSSFSQCEDKSQIHGNHIHGGKSVWEKFVANKELVNEMFGTALKEFYP